MKAFQVEPGMFLDLEGIQIPALDGGMASRRHVPNWVLNVRVARKYVYLTLGDFRVWKVEKTYELNTRKPYCFCDSKTRAKISFFCPEHEPLNVSV
ncbi:hypothetical protein GCM10010423_65640 [Streptomyces levis]|uniref:Uncharacterized protein n=1 Tax=Streptomyces levis TaxID=285566 RepID=A0ABP6BHJ1_9ACTN